MKWTKLAAVVCDLRVLLFFVLSSLSLQVSFASNITEKITVTGVWPTTQRELPSIPITASIEGSILSINNSSPTIDITITIMDDSGKIVWMQEVSAANTASITISLSELPAGAYTLSLMNLYGGDLQGYFCIE